MADAPECDFRKEFDTKKLREIIEAVVIACREKNLRDPSSSSRIVVSYLKGKAKIIRC